MPLLNELATASYDATHSFDQVVHFVHVLVIEPHPRAPDLSPYGGKLWEGPYSTITQPATYAERAAVGQKLLFPLLEGSQVLLIDDLAPRSVNNPVWCSYGPAPNSAFLIRQDGVIEIAQQWLDVDRMEAAIRALLGK